jgi:hypothetical protein
MAARPSTAASSIGGGDGDDISVLDGDDGMPTVDGPPALSRQRSHSDSDLVHLAYAHV